MTSPVLDLKGLSKSYGAVRAVVDLDLSINKGEVVALLGENGAGKSTVVNMITGMTAPDNGQISIAGQAVAFANTRDALDQGIGVVHQHYALVGGFTVAETLALGNVGLGRLDQKALHQKVRDIARSIRMQMDPDARIGDLDVAGQQRVEILKALSRDIKLLILDEPTAVLPPEDAERLFEVVRGLQAEGVAVLIITHRLSDVFAVCDRAAVMHAGRMVSDQPVANVTQDGLIRAMISGTASEDEAEALSEFLGVNAHEVHERAHAVDASVKLKVRDLKLHRSGGSLAVEGVSFDLRQGEILAVAGVDGNGQSELTDCLCGLKMPDEGEVQIGHLSSARKGWSPRAIRRSGLGYIPEDRARFGIVAELDLSDNILLSHFFSDRYFRRGIVRSSRVTSDTKSAIADYDIRTTGPGQPIGRLSGGNQQKLVIARELLAGPQIIVAAHPSRGLDVRTIAFVQKTLKEQRDAGAAIVLVSADLAEIQGLADQVVVFAAGRAKGPVQMADTTMQEIGSWMAGHA